MTDSPRVRLRNGEAGVGDLVRLWAGRYRRCGEITHVLDENRIVVRNEHDKDIVWWARSCERVDSPALSRRAAEARYVCAARRRAEREARSLSDADLIAAVNEADDIEIVRLTRPEDET